MVFPINKFDSSNQTVTTSELRGGFEAIPCSAFSERQSREVLGRRSPKPS
jgi:hypothetical protein